MQRNNHYLCDVFIEKTFRHRWMRQLLKWRFFIVFVARLLLEYTWYSCKILKIIVLRFVFMFFPGKVMCDFLAA